jgi:hypothetical protein
MYDSYKSSAKLYSNTVLSCLLFGRILSKLRFFTESVRLGNSRVKQRHYVGLRLLKGQLKGPKTTIPMSIDNFLELDNIIVPPAFLRNLHTDCLHLYLETEHAINGAQIWKQLMIYPNGEWSLQVRGQEVQKSLIGLQFANCIEHQQTVFSVIQKCNICIGKTASRFENTSAVAVDGQYRCFGGRCTLVLPLSSISNSCR